MNFILGLVGLILVGCSQERPVVPVSTTAGATLSAQTMTLPEPHRYQNRLTWSGAPSGDFFLFRSEGDERAQKLTAIVSSTGEFVDGAIKDGGRYRYFIGANELDSTVFSDVVVPLDFDSRDMGGILKETLYLAGYNRVFLYKLAGPHQVTIKAKEIYAFDSVIDTSAPQDPVQTPGSDGASAFRTYLLADRISGDIELVAEGQPGGPQDAVKGFGKRGRGGDLIVSVKEKSIFRIKARLRNTPTDKSDPSSAYEPSAVSISSAGQPTFLFTKSILPALTPPIDGLYQIGTELFYLSPGWGLSKVAVLKDGILLKNLGSASALEEGALIDYWSYDVTKAPNVDFGLQQNGINRSGTKVLRTDTRGEIKKLWKFSAQISELAGDFQRLRTHFWITADESKPLLMDDVDPSEIISTLSDNAWPIMRSLQENKMLGIHIHLSEETVFEVRNRYLFISGQPRPSLEAILKTIRGEK